MIAVLSDVHANLPALEAVLADIDAAGASRVWCLGDTLGYGPFADECMLLVSRRCELVLAGNHDLAVRGDVPVSTFAGTAGAGIEHARRVLGDEARAILAGLTAQKFLDGVELYHASAADPVWEYVRTSAVATRHLRLQRAPLGLVGHSHEQIAFELSEGARGATGGMVAEGTVIELGVGGTRRVLNPGSVGQPRDRDPRAAWLLVEEGRATFRRAAYDIARMRAAVAAAGLPAEIGERLELGW